ncbi:GNAT family N-acetyltransferase [Natronomonas halophila]|uniref:GNAT family N-acetyltransferase n=1 Tax=Natronomonas halophila TaxID=2747817 RepID=UPI0015B4D4C8|nr:GNAT family N-acetyltransferase [Natronomonas halophila]QLD84933.1 GNAT family N-acetyltransferase [Natronomonas halophila]
MAPDTAAPVLLGWPEDGPTLRLDYREFSYAGKFVMSNTGKAVIRRADARDAATDGKWDEDILAAVAFNEDRTDSETLWLRYVTVREDCRGEGLGPRLCAFVAERAGPRGYERVRIAVNNPFAYEALYKAGFAFTGEETGVAELVLERPARERAEQPTEQYQAGFDVYRRRKLSAAETDFLERKHGAEPPSDE